MRRRSVICVRRVETSRTRVLVIETRAGRVFVELDELDDVASAINAANAGARHVTIGDGCRCAPDLLDPPHIVDVAVKKKAS